MPTHQINLTVDRKGGVIKTIVLPVEMKLFCVGGIRISHNSDILKRSSDSVSCIWLQEMQSTGKSLDKKYREKYPFHFVCLHERQGKMRGLQKKWGQLDKAGGEPNLMKVCNDERKVNYTLILDDVCCGLALILYNDLLHRIFIYITSSLWL